MCYLFGAHLSCKPQVRKSKWRLIGFVKKEISMESLVMSPSLCKSPFIRHMNLETRALVDDGCTGKRSPPIGPVWASCQI